MDRYFARYPGVARYMEETRASRTQPRLRRNRFSVAVCGCRKFNSSNAARRQGAERAAINAPMQGTAADLIKRAMLAVQGWLDSAKNAHTCSILQVHDELVLEVPEEELTLPQSATRCRRLMGGMSPNWPCRYVVEVGVGANWDEAH
jgi:DNA polymerase-1